MSAPNADPIQVYLGFAGNNPAGPWCVCSLGVVGGRSYPYIRIVPGARTNFGAAWAAVALSIERLAGRPATLWTTLSSLEQQAVREPHPYEEMTEEDKAIRATTRSTGAVVRYVSRVEAPHWLTEAQDTARRGFAQWRLDEQGKVLP